MALPTRGSQDALDVFVTTQLIDNGMDTLAKKINRLYLKLQRTRGDADAQKKYAKQLHHYLTLSCRLLASHRDDMTHYIATIERDLKCGVLEGAKHSGTGGKESMKAPRPTPTPSSYALMDDDVLQPGRHVAAKVARSHELWILARVISYDFMTRAYEVEDVDTGEDEDGGGGSSDANFPTRRRHIVPRYQVKALPSETLPGDDWIHYELNQPVMAVYPNTTSFYRGVVRVPNPKGAPYVLVRFDDDADEFGSLAPDRKIPFRFVVAA